MSEERMINEGTSGDPSAPVTDSAVDNEGGHRLPNLQKLYHVPVFALRELLRSRVPGKKFANLRQAELVAEADRLPTVSAVDVDLLYENYRYGRSLAFYLYLLPSDLVQPDMETLQVVLDELAAPENNGPEDEDVSVDDYESEHYLNQVILLDEERLNSIREFRFRYYVAHHFLNADEQPDQVLQTRYGFLWLDLHLGYLAILSRDERVNHLLTRALATCLKAIPLPVRFAKELVDQHFSIERVKRVSHYDPGTGIRQSLSGDGLWKSFEKEILAREQQYTRPSSMYEEQVANGVTSGLGITASKGKLYLTKTLPTSQVRAWGLQRLPALVADVKALREQEPEQFGRSLESINRMRLPLAGKSVILHIAEGLLKTQREDLTSVELPLTALEIYEALEGKYFSPYLRTQCSECQEIAELCPHCESRNLDIDEGRAICKGCGASFLDQGSVTLCCMDGHMTVVPQAEAFSIAPNHWLQKRMVRIFAEISLEWREHADYFYIEANTLHRLRRGEIEEERQPGVVQAYIHNFWEPVTGQVQPGPDDGRITYKNFDLRVRGIAPGGYTVEASSSDGGSVSPLPLTMPQDPEFLSRLEQFLRQPGSSKEIQLVGKVLFKTLFPSGILKLWSRAVGSLDNGMGLRTRLNITPSELMSLPWELIFEDEFKALRLRFPMVRYLDLLDPPKPLAVQPPLRVLVAVSQPGDQPSLAADIELANIHDALGRLSEQVDMDVMHHPTRDGLLARLRRGHHVLHYVGHGVFEEDEGYLVLEDENGFSDLTSALLLGQMVADSNLRLVVLNACETSVSGPGTPFGGVAQQLVKGGMSAVIAMQRPIGDRAAVAFSRGFYGALAVGWPVDTAVQEGRRSIVTAQGNDWNHFVDWAIPTLYMRAPDGIILKVQRGQ
jgi:hypothetical protein